MEIKTPEQWDNEYSAASPKRRYELNFDDFLVDYYHRNTSSIE